MKTLTDRQREILDFIKGFIKDHKYPPTIREIAGNFSISVPPLTEPGMYQAYLVMTSYYTIGTKIPFQIEVLRFGCIDLQIYGAPDESNPDLLGLKILPQVEQDTVL